MFLSEIKKLLVSRSLNTKNNNYIITQLSKENLEDIIKTLSISDLTIENYENMKKEHYGIVSKTQKIIQIDLSKTPVNEIFNEIFKKLEIEDKLYFTNKIDILKFNRTLIKEKKSVSIVLYNIKDIDKEDTKLINELLSYKTYAYTIIYLIYDVNDVSSYETQSGKMLDGREDYELLRLSLNI